MGIDVTLGRFMLSVSLFEYLSLCLDDCFTRRNGLSMKKYSRDGVFAKMKFCTPTLLFRINANL
mgnify:CR=1 FL=1